MKEFIEFNYNILFDVLEEGESSYSFKFNNEIYLFCVYKRNIKDIQDIIECSRELKIKKIESFDIIENKDKKILTKIDDIDYILLKIPNNYSEEIDIIDIINFNNKTKINDSKKKEYKNNWGHLWSEKVDYFEYQVSELGKGKNIVLDSFSYYIGLAENAISMVNKANKMYDYGKNESICLSHRRIFYPNIILNYCNPLSYLIDLEIRDVAEYIKSIFYSGEDALLELTTYLKSVKLSNYSYQMLYSRLLFPSIYFDLYEDAIENKEKEEKIINIIKQTTEFEYFLKESFNLISKYSIVEELDWLK